MYFTVVIRLNIIGCILCINMVNRDIMVDEDDENINYISVLNYIKIKSNKKSLYLKQTWKIKISLVVYLSE